MIFKYIDYVVFSILTDYHGNCIRPNLIVLTKTETFSPIFWSNRKTVVFDAL